MSNSPVFQRQLLLEMLRVRMIEESIADHYPELEMRCPVHLSIGQEAPAVGVCAALKKSDWVFSGHRNHAHYLAKGGDLNKMIAEIYGKATGCCEGKGGSMHLTDQESGFIGATPIVGSTVPIAVGAAFTAQKSHNGRVVVIFLGDGAMETGVVHESLNFAVLKSLPIIFACENNLYSVYSPIEVRQPPHRSLAHLAGGHGIRVVSVDGNDVEAVFTTSIEAVTFARSGGGPVFIDLPTYRWREHCGPAYDNEIGYRTEEEFLEWKKSDPIARLRHKIQFLGLEADIVTIKEEIEDAFLFAKKSPFPSASAAATHVYA
jgi:TPP-dependent pyruvate/acetoin dehydrogenase alpha subunit